MRKKERWKANAWVGLLFLVATASCRPRIDFGPTGRLESAEQVFARVQETSGGLKSLQGDARMQLSSPEGSGNAGVFVSASKPGFLYLEVHDFFGKPQATLVTDGALFGSYQAQDGVYYRGPATPANVSRLLPVVLPTEELVGLFLGQVRLIQGAQATRLEVDERMGAYRLTLEGEGQNQTLWVHPTLFRIQRSEGPGSYSVQMDDFLGVGDLVFPQKIRLEAPAARTEIKLTYKMSSLQVNVSQDASTYDLSAPEGVPVVELDEAGHRK